MDWTQVSIAIITLCGTIVVTLVPVMVTAWVNAHTAKLIQVKAVADNNQDIANGIVAVVQNVYKALTNSGKLQKAFEKLDARLHLPADQTLQLIEQAVSILTLTLGKEWEKLGEPSTTAETAVIPDQPIPQETPTDPDTLPLP